MTLARLSPREEQVVRARALGEPYKDIALRLGLSPFTVKTYAGRAFVKLGVRTSYELAPIVLRARS